MSTSKIILNMGCAHYLALLIFTFFPIITSLGARQMRMSASLEKDIALSNCLKTNPTGLRLFHPAFLYKLLDPLDVNEADTIKRLKKFILSNNEEVYNAEYEKLPWFALPRQGVPDSPVLRTKKEIEDCYERTKHMGELIWAHKLERPEKGCLLLNHWNQQVVFLAEYDPLKGSKGWALDLDKPEKPAEMTWPPLSLEFELTNRHWQPVSVSDTLLSKNVLKYLPKESPQALWELIFLCLVTREKEPELMQMFLDTGLSPRRGLIAYTRLLNKILERAEALESLPAYLQISEQETLI